MRDPDQVIGAPGAPYLLRWYLVPHNRYFNVYLHKILRSDDERALHDHPWWSLSLILKGGYEEITATGRRYRGRGSCVLRRPSVAHRLVLPVLRGGITYCWTLFLTGPKVREWGFHCPQGWVPWQRFVDPHNPGAPGKGCDS